MCHRYLSYRDLIEAKRKAIDEWKRETSVARNKLHETALVTEVLKPSEVLDGVQMYANIGAIVDESNRKSSSVTESERQATKQRIREWRAERARQQLAEEV